MAEDDQNYGQFDGRRDENSARSGQNQGGFGGGPSSGAGYQGSGGRGQSPDDDGGVDHWSGSSGSIGSQRDQEGSNNGQQGGFGQQGRTFSGNRSGQGGFGQRGGGLGGQQAGGLGQQSGQGEHRGKGPKDYKRSNERIKEDVNDRLTDDDQLDASEISVEVADGEVTLSGTVPDRQAKRRAEDTAHDVSGVTHVQNNLRVSQSWSSGGQSSQAGSGRDLPPRSI